MANTIFQKAYDKIKSITTPTWLKSLLQELQDLMFGVLRSAGKSYIDYITALILEAAQRTDLSGEQKFQYVLNNAKASGINTINDLKDNELNTLINFLYSKIKPTLS